MEIKSREISIVDVHELVSDPKNENKHSEKQLEVLQKVIKINGFREPLTVSNRSGYVICGNGRLEAAKRMGMIELPVIYQDFENEAEETRHRLADNEIARYAELDKDLMLDNLKGLDIDLEDFDFEEIGLISFEPMDDLGADDFDDGEDKINNESFLSSLRKEISRLVKEGDAKGANELDANLKIEACILQSVKKINWSSVESSVGR